MPDLPRRHLVVLVLVGVVVVVAAMRWSRPPAPPASSPAAASRGVEVARTPPVPAGVHVAGEVRRPGVYRLRTGTRVEEAVQRAGGPTHRGDLDALNLAAKVDDGRQIVVPARAPSGAPSAGAAAGPAADGSPAVPGPPVNLNSATAEELGTLDGVGPATAAKILAHRREHGGFRSVDELDEVPGIGPKRLAALRERVTV